MRHFRCVQSVKLHAETLSAGSIFVAIQSDYVQALLDNGLIVAVVIDETGQVTEMPTEPAGYRLPNGVVAVPCT